MKQYQGTGICKAVAVGKVFLYRREAENTAVCHVEDKDIEIEKKRFLEAKERTYEQLQTLYEEALGRLQKNGEDNARIFKAHALLLQDVAFLNPILQQIEQEKFSAESAVRIMAERLAVMFEAMEDAYLQMRADDIRDVSRRILYNLAEKVVVMPALTEPVVLCADDFSPSETIMWERDKILALVTAHGSVHSHTAILARSMNIPAIVGIGEEFLRDVEMGEMIAVDGDTGIVYRQPTQALLEHICGQQEKQRKQKRRLEQLKGKENVTPDGRRIEIYANISGVEELGEVLENDAGGIGLFRSEFLYLGRESYPTEEEQFVVYQHVLSKMEDRRVVIRTLDIGADKQEAYFSLSKEANPALGLRAIRLCLRDPLVFKAQLRALYRASVYGNLAILFPMVISEAEVREIQKYCNEVKKELAEQEIPYREDVPLGIMIETPAAAILSDKLADMVDFFSIGTNDLTQYTLACDRQNEAVASLFDPHHEAVLRLVERTVKSAHEKGIRTGICGELAADTSLTGRFLEWGIDELSVSPSMVLKVREAVINEKNVG